MLIWHNYQCTDINCSCVLLSCVIFIEIPSWKTDSSSWHTCHLSQTENCTKLVVASKIRCQALFLQGVATTALAFRRVAAAVCSLGSVFSGVCLLSLRAFSTSCLQWDQAGLIIAKQNYCWYWWTSVHRNDCFHVDRFKNISALIIFGPKKGLSWSTSLSIKLILQTGQVTY